jgi:Na+-transporting NADH:ubiquinone oxidoreductase subunit NqrB
MDGLLSLLAAPSVAVGVLAGLGVALLFHWFAPVGTDTVTAGAWFVGLGCLLGLLWPIFRKRK